MRGAGCIVLPAWERGGPHAGIGRCLSCASVKENSGRVAKASCELSDVNRDGNIVIFQMALLLL